MVGFLLWCLGRVEKNKFGTRLGTLLVPLPLMFSSVP